jgi:hypothetical protein
LNVIPVGSTVTLATGSPEVLSELTHATFAEELGSPFQLDWGAAKPLKLELVEATELAPASVGMRRTPFSLLFRGPRQPVLPQKIYPLDHNRLGRLEIFIVPLGPDGEGMRYEAVFT